VALRPLRLGDLYDGAFKTIRRNPKAMVGLAAGVIALFMVVPAVLSLLLAALGQLSLGSALSDSGGPAGPLVAFGAGYLGAFFGAFATVVLNGMLVHVVAQAVLGRKTTIAEAWHATKGRLLRLVGLTLLDGALATVVLGVPVAVGIVVGSTVGTGQGFLVGVPLLLAAVVLLVFVQVRFFQLAAPALVLERIGVFAALRRAARLSRRQWWRLFAITLLTTVLVGLVGQVLGIPFALVGGIGSVALSGTGGGLLLVFSSYLSQIVVGALTTPFTSAVVALQYVDQRIRKEGLDVQLIAASQGQPAEMR
jgi:membrane-anchored glycerophosphoryl diester phosphodiesterase (GDPDase)